MFVILIGNLLFSFVRRSSRAQLDLTNLVNKNIFTAVTKLTHLISFGLIRVVRVDFVCILIESSVLGSFRSLVRVGSLPVSIRKLVLLSLRKS